MELNRDAAIEQLKTGKKIVVHNCSMCSYPCGYVMHGEQLYYDCGCDCTSYGSRLEPRTMGDLDDYLERQAAWERKQTLNEASP